jgi:hypothetical protein
MAIPVIRVTVDKVDDNKYSVNLNGGFGKWTVTKVDRVEEAREIAATVIKTVDILRHEKLLRE